MGTKLKIMNGTRTSSTPRLCDTCQSGLVRKGAAESDERIYCLIMERNLETRVVECSRYVDRAQPSLWEMKQIAWVLNTDSKREAIGFIRAKEWERKHWMKNCCRRTWIDSPLVEPGGGAHLRSRSLEAMSRLRVYFFGWAPLRKLFGSSGKVNATTVSDAVMATYCLPFFAS